MRSRRNYSGLAEYVFNFTECINRAGCPQIVVVLHRTTLYINTALAQLHDSMDTILAPSSTHEAPGTVTIEDRTLATSL